MQCLTLLASIASLSAYTLVAVHAQPGCTDCPVKVSGVPLFAACVNSKTKTTQCSLSSYLPSWIGCDYDEHGALSAASQGASCPSPMNLHHGCQSCT
ncbi:hypothetical protein PAXRUDRAFT_834750 [Paxillus rubicundulus Ve08.2h10]|uniref:Unplaced genomic scaffold scaffold_1913, whole genome shotgun sequence n=1 Tax=Paxillus rubicundulus Ve08.2h10 TaxID=930991 RepID=A0A0D0CRP2_9AGAM|nr:hypothetical protein PAXRUDRAFT_834750 [Paxillus rubicundulus Ve08.2h10]